MRRMRLKDCIHLLLFDQMLKQTYFKVNAKKSQDFNSLNICFITRVGYSTACCILQVQRSYLQDKINAKFIKQRQLQF